MAVHAATEVKARISLAMSAMTRLATIWKSNAISFPIKFKLYKTLVLSILMYGCESWTLTADLERIIQAFEHKCFRKLLRISYTQLYTEHKTNEVKQKVTPSYHQASQAHLVRPCHTSWLFGKKKNPPGHRSRNTKESLRHWFDNVKEWTTHKEAHLLRLLLPK